MRRMMVLASAAAIAMSMSVGAAAAPSQAQNYWAIDATCDELGDITIEVTNLGNWGAAKIQKIQGTQLTGIPRWFTFDVTYQDNLVFSESHDKRPADVDDICAYSWTEEVPEGDPLLEAGIYLLEGKVGVKVVGR